MAKGKTPGVGKDGMTGRPNKCVARQGGSNVEPEGEGAEEDSYMIGDLGKGVRDGGRR